MKTKSYFIPQGGQKFIFSLLKIFCFKSQVHSQKLLNNWENDTKKSTIARDHRLLIHEVSCSMASQDSNNILKISVKYTHLNCSMGKVTFMNGIIKF